MSNREQPSRRRGIRASRTRLYRALTAAGFKTQAALAESMADLEGLAQAPKDVVSRVFREQPVELPTLERVARALGVDAWELYKTADEPEPASAGGPGHTTPAPRPARIGRWHIGVGLLLLLLGFAGLWWVQQDSTASDSRTIAATAISLLDPGPPTLALHPIAGDSDDQLTAALRLYLDQQYTLSSPTATVLTHDLEADAVAQRLRVQAVVEGELLTVGRYSAVRIYLYTGSVRAQVWAETVPTIELDENRLGIAANAARAIADRLGVPAAGDDEWPLYFPAATAQDYYLEGLAHLDGPASELNVLRAQSRFEAALRQDPDYADAHAGLCRALLEEYWMEEAQRALADAAQACNRALQLAPTAPATRLAQAHFLRVTGRLEEALDSYGILLTGNPRDAAALLDMAVTLLQLFHRDGNPADLEAARAAATQATVAAPDFWKPPFWLATLEYTAGDIGAAIASAEEARGREENEFILANLGTFYFCANNLTQARLAYERARDIAPQSYVGDEFLGMLLYLQADYAGSAQLRQRAIDNLSAVGQPEIHEMWGNLADSYLHNGASAAAVRAFVKAAEIAERDVLQGIGTPADRASRGYYYTMLQQLVPEQVPVTAREHIVADMEAASATILEPGPAIRLAKAWLQHGRPERALRAFEQAVSSCAGYANTPGLDSLRAMLVVQ
ncbi:tetratricopeptide repeat protein [Kineobactrum salinum]|uniref:Tetratricopeptide repeat protein n=1 Tax=Kineobactrum salinum TaxID=2708301 RepID=A0A6C0U3G1_9GAMM|nr:tetratricopeptide repeat protein [Kineobactrum salinum]QIB66700.1 tetratricopeptide repeat protein [Kineobactrum salinum]